MNLANGKSYPPTTSHFLFRQTKQKEGPTMGDDNENVETETTVETPGGTEVTETQTPVEDDAAESSDSED